MEKSTIIAGAAVVGGLSLIYFLTRKKDQTALGADYESAAPGESPPSDTTFYDQDLADEDPKAFCGAPKLRCGLSDDSLKTRWTPDGSMKQFFHEPYGHWCYMVEHDSPFKDSTGSMYDQGLCQRRPHSWSPSNWTEAQVDQAGKQLVC